MKEFVSVRGNDRCELSWVAGRSPNYSAKHDVHAASEPDSV